MSSGRWINTPCAAALSWVWSWGWDELGGEMSSASSAPVCAHPQGQPPSKTPDTWQEVPPPWMCPSTPHPLTLSHLRALGASFLAWMWRGCLSGSRPSLAGAILIHVLLPGTWHGASQRLGCSGKLVEALETREGMDGGKDRDDIQITQGRWSGSEAE